MWLLATHHLSDTQLLLRKWCSFNIYVPYTRTRKCRSLIELVKLIFDDIEISCRHNKVNPKVVLCCIVLCCWDASNYKILLVARHSFFQHREGRGMGEWGRNGCINLLWQWQAARLTFPLERGMESLDFDSIFGGWLSIFIVMWLQCHLNVASTYIINDFSTCVSGSLSFVEKQFYLLFLDLCL